MMSRKQYLGKITHLSHYFVYCLGLWEIKEKQDAVTKTINEKNPLSVFIINCVSVASLNTSRDIFQESLHINVSTYHCLYYLPIDKKFLLYSEHEQVIKYNMNVYTVEVYAL